MIGRTAAAANGCAAVRGQANQAPGHVQATRWMLLSRDPEILRPFGVAHVSRSAPWTDTWSQPLAAFRWQGAVRRL
ncbi:hypothetical protein LuPra_03259 [Luteitalea pratensis]|uniref:Uncharacterized protein n=1 Tax=Luteitalea pratensis TaxID=1855912 RepID=A0A143PNJ7_LUTPR|nr:hypothetical protein [Luteitalea pratensis]AMY10031.1 hypothetical protein LuPra_03259 [Luteitalea pratensis]